MAQRLYLSESFFYVIYKQCFGVSPAHDLQMIRIERACELLTNTTLSITEISTQVGYTDYRFFNKSFKKITGVTAHEYRKKNE